MIKNMYHASPITHKFPHNFLDIEVGIMRPQALPQGKKALNLLGRIVMTFTFYSIICISNM